MDNAKPWAWDRITAISSVVVALLSMGVAVIALLFSIRQAEEDRRHQRLSLMPALVYWENSNWELRPQGIVIRNAGIGPAFVDSMVVFDDERRIGPWNDETWNLMNAALAAPASVLFERAMFEPGAVIAQGNEWLLLGFAVPSRSYVQWINAVHERFGFALWYRSAYEEVRRLTILAANVPPGLR